MNDAPLVIQANALTKSFGEHKALDGISLEVRKGEFFSLLGPSGCGKTTLLKILAGLENADSGELLIGGRSMAGVPAHRRNVNTVFQSYALFPHLNVYDNIAFGLKMKKVSRSEIAPRVNRMLDLFELGPFKARKPDALSGGQKQRVALARAVINEPELLLLDEPMAALDAQLRRQLQKELTNFQRSLGTTFVFVTHDQEEALTMSSRMAVMNQGKIEQVGTPHDLYEFPRTTFVASFLGAANILKLLGRESGFIHTSIGPLPATPTTNSNVGNVCIRPEKIRLVPDGTPLNSKAPAIVQEIVYTGAERHYRLQCNGVSIWSHRPSSESPFFKEGDKVSLDISPDDLRYLQ